MQTGFQEPSTWVIPCLQSWSFLSVPHLLFFSWFSHQSHSSNQLSTIHPPFICYLPTHPSSIHPSTRPPTHPPSIHPPSIHLPTYIHPPSIIIHLSNHPSTIHSFINQSTHSAIYPSIYQSSIYPTIRLFTYSFIHSPIHALSTIH